MIISLFGLLAGIALLLVAAPVLEAACVAVSVESAHLTHALATATLTHTAPQLLRALPGVELVASVAAPGVLVAILVLLGRGGRAARRLGVLTLLIAGVASFAVVPARQSLALIGVGIVLLAVVAIAGVVFDLGVNALGAGLGGASVLLALHSDRTHVRSLAAWASLHTSPSSIWLVAAIAIACLPVLGALGAVLRR